MPSSSTKGAANNHYVVINKKNVNQLGLVPYPSLCGAAAAYQ
jgi:hypothetical protein